MNKLPVYLPYLCPLLTVPAHIEHAGLGTESATCDAASHLLISRRADALQGHGQAPTKERRIASRNDPLGRYVHLPTIWGRDWLALLVNPDIQVTPVSTGKN